MPLLRKRPVSVLGQGELRLQGLTTVVDISIEGEREKLRPGPARMRGSFTAEPELAEAAFRAGEAVLTIEGQPYRLTILGYTAGSDTAYFEMRL